MRSQNAGGQFHRDAVQAAVLPNQRQARDADDLAVRETALQARERLRDGGIVVGWRQYRTDDVENVGVTRGETAAGRGVFGLRPGQRHEAIRFVTIVAQCLFFGFFVFVFFVVFV